MFLFAALMGVIGSVIGSVSRTHNVLLAARVIQGFAVCAYESLNFAIIGDIFFVHERGVYVSIMTSTLASVSNLTSVVAGPVTKTLGWQYLFHLYVLTIWIQLVLTFLFVPETAYHRDTKYKFDQTSTEASGEDLTVD